MKYLQTLQGGHKHYAEHHKGGNKDHLCSPSLAIKSSALRPEEHDAYLQLRSAGERRTSHPRVPRRPLTPHIQQTSWLLHLVRGTQWSPDRGNYSKSSLSIKLGKLCK